MLIKPCVKITRILLNDLRHIKVSVHVLVRLTSGGNLATLSGFVVPELIFVAHGAVEYSLVARGIHNTTVTRVVISVFKAVAAFDTFRSRWRHTRWSGGWADAIYIYLFIYHIIYKSSNRNKVHDKFGSMHFENQITMQIRSRD